MSNFITNGSEYNGRESIDIITRQLKETALPAGIRIIETSNAGSVKLTFFDAMTKRLMPYASGWQGGSGATKRQKKFDLAEFKAEASYEKQDYYDTVLEQVVRKNGDNDIDGTAVHQAELEVFTNAIMYDMWRIFWLGDTDKVHLAAGTYPDGSTTYAIGDGDKYYNNIDGIWKSIFNAAVAYGSATINDIRRITISNGAVAEVDFRTLTIASGTITVTYKGKAFSEAFDTDAATTVTNFVASHAADISELGITVTDEGSAVLKSVSDRAGVSMGAVYAASTGSWAAAGGTDVANVVASGLADDEALDTFQSMIDNSAQVLKSLRTKPTTNGMTPLRIYATQSMIDNYEASLSATTIEIPETYYNMVDGVKRLTYKGIPVIEMNIDGELEADFEGYLPHRAILTTEQNICMVLSDMNGIAELRTWFENKDNANLQRSQFEFGADFFLPEMCTVAY